MVALEKELSGFDEAAFVKRFKQAGGAWFSFSLDDYHSFDGSHLHRDSAVQFSKDLAKRIRNYIEHADGQSERSRGTKALAPDAKTRKSSFSSANTKNSK